MNNIGKAIKCVLVLRDLNQNELAKHMGISKTFASFLLTGKNAITEKHKVKIEEALQIDWEDIIYLSTLLNHQGIEDRNFFDELDRTLRTIESGGVK